MLIIILIFSPKQYSLQKIPGPEVCAEMLFKYYQN